MKNLLIFLLFSFFVVRLDAQYFNDFYIKQQLGFYEEKSSKSYEALEVLKKFILEENKSRLVENPENNYFKKFSNVFFNPNVPQKYYSYIPTSYYIKNDVIVFEIDVIESVNINNKINNILYVSAFIPVNLKSNLILLDDSNLNFLQNINTINLGSIKVISNNLNIDKKEIFKIKNYIRENSKILDIKNIDLKKNPLMIISSKGLNDGYFYYGINKYISYVNNYLDNKIFAGNNSLFYKHELIHYLISLKTKNKINPVIDEGLATWLGGSTKYSYEEFINKSTQDKSNDEINTLIDKFLKDDNNENNNKYEYFIRALFVNAIFKSKENLDEKVLNNIISQDIYNFSIKEIINKLGLNVNEIKFFMMSKINKDINK